MKRHSLNRKIKLSCLLFSIVLVVAICSTISTWFWNQTVDNYQTIAYSYTRTVAKYIDGNRLSTYLETEERDAYYDEILSLMYAIRAEGDLKYFTVFVPQGDELVYIWDADEVENAYPLGCREKLDNADELNELYRYFDQNAPEEMSVYDDELLGYIASAYTPILDDSGEPVALVGADFSMQSIRKAFWEFILIETLCVILTTLLSSLVFTQFIRKNVVTPIVLLEKSAEVMADNLAHDDSAWPEIHTEDEIEQLAKAFRKMDGEVREYISRLANITAEKERIGAELDVAAKIQISMLPCIFPPFPNRTEFDIYATMDPAKEVGGDFYDFFMVDEDHLAFVVADVSGKGVPAALFMVIGKTLIKDHTEPGKDLGEVFTEVNRILCSSNSEEMFITAFEGVLNLKTGELRYVNAGHETPFICRKGGVYEPVKVKRCFVLAGMNGIKYSGGSIQLYPGDKIFQYTDGIPEAINSKVEQYGMDRLHNVLMQNSGKTPNGLLDAVKADVDTFVGEADQFDDITMLCLRYDGLGE